MTPLALANAASSSPRLFVSASNSSAFVIQSWCKSDRPLISPARSLDVTWRSPSKAAFFSPAAAIPSFASFNSLLLYLISSFKDCSNISKAWVSCVSFFRAASSWSSDFSRRSVSVSKIPPLWLSYTAPAGAPMSSSSLELCTSAVSRLASEVVIAEAETKTLSACATLAAFFNCNMEAPPFISRSMMPMARCKVSMISDNSFSSATKASFSLARISVAAFTSASSMAISPESCSTLACKAPTVASSWAIAACNSATSAFPVLMSF
mmetsp:Transcript_12009/g.30215  ORF Transcript_12009/g.30215 Transcript_12009/m.30215 type:complete len:266 (-) Transcript_12009:259-1056(-)